MYGSGVPETLRRESCLELETLVRPKGLGDVVGGNGRRDQLRRVLGPVSLTSLGIEGIIGAGDLRFNRDGSR